MVNPFQMLQNPMGAIQNQMLEKMKAQNPQMFQQVQQMVSGKSDAEVKEMAFNVAKERGIDLKQFATQFGINI